MYKMEVLIEDFYSEFFIYATMMLNILLRIRSKGRWKKVDWEIKLKFFYKESVYQVRNESSSRMSKKYSAFLYTL